MQWTDRLSAMGRRRTWIVAALYILAACAPFSLFGVDLAILLLYGLLLAGWRQEATGPRLPRWLIVAWCALPAAALLAALANGIEAPLASGVERPEIARNLLNLRLLYRWALPLALVSALAYVDRRRWLLALLVSTLLMGVYSLIQSRWGVDWFRPPGQRLVTIYREHPTVYLGKGNFSHHITFGHAMLMPALLFASLAWAEVGRRRALWLTGAALAAAGVLVSFSRSAWLGLLVGAILLAARFPRRLAWALAGVVIGLALATAPLQSGWLSSRLVGDNPPALVERLLSINLDQNRERLLLWESALAGIRERPWLGVGLGNHAPYVVPVRERIEVREHYKFIVGIETHMHNTYLQLAYDTGLLGLAALAAWWFAVYRWMRMGLRVDGAAPFERALLYGTAAGCAGMLAAGLFNDNFFDGEVQALALTLVGLALHSSVQTQRNAGEAHRAAPRI